MKKYNKDNCDSRLRAVITDKYGRTISLLGKHAFEWEIIIELSGRLIVRQYPNGKEARKAFNQLKRKRI